MRLRLRYSTGTAAPWATIETMDGYYVATVEKCDGEGDKAWRRRVRSVQTALSRGKDLLTTKPRPSARRRTL